MAFEKELYDTIQTLALRTRRAMSDYIEPRLRAYEERKAKRDFPVITFLGNGRCGKDTAALILAEIRNIKAGGSTSSIAAPLMGYALGKTTEQAFAERHEDRMFWFKFLNEFRKEDPTLLAKMLLAEGDMVVGLRSDVELKACLDEGVIDHAWWIHRPGTPDDLTVEFDDTDCDFIILNNGSLYDFKMRLYKLADLYNFPTHDEE